MGLNTTIMILNDYLHQIKEDEDFGPDLAHAISINQKDYLPYGIKIIETHHSDDTAIIAVGGNYGSVINIFSDVGRHDRPEDAKRILELLATRLGYKLVKK